MVPSLDQSSGGPLRSVFDLASSTAAYGLQSQIAGVGESSAADNPSRETVVHSFSAKWSKSYAYSPGLKSWLRANIEQFDGVLLHGMWQYPAFAAASECRRAHMPYVCVPHGMLEPWAVSGQGWPKYFKKFIYWHLAEKRSLHSAAGIVFATSRECRLARDVFSFPLLCTILPPFGVSEPHDTMQESVRDDIVRLNSSSYALFLGRIHPKKNLELLLRCWASARREDDWQLVIAGPAQVDYLTQLKCLAESLNIDHKVRFLRFVSGVDKAHLLRNAKWLLLPSKQENFGIVVLEALQYGCPVAMSDQVFLADEFVDSAAILPLQMNDWTAFFRLRMADEAYRSTCIEKGREVLFRQYNIETVAKLWAAALGALFRCRCAADPAMRIRASGGVRQ